MTEDLNIPVELMMENAGFHLASLVVTRWLPEGTITIISGPGNNGAGGLVAARKLKAWKENVEVIIPRGIDELNSIGKIQLERAQSMNIPISDSLSFTNSEDTILIDAYLGYGYTDRIDPITNSVFEVLSNHHTVICLDVPSGLNSNTGESREGFKPSGTLTIAFPKKGLLLAEKKKVGDLFVCDIGIPMSVYESQLGIEWIKPYNLRDLLILYGQFFAGVQVKAKKKIDRKTGQLGWKFSLTY
jgi:NAD(P)H-hydrate epimerase